MGTFQVQLDIAGPARDRYESVEALVDTGSTYTVLPRRLLEELGVEPEAQARLRLADGRVVTRDLGRVWVRFEGDERYTLVVFGKHTLLGAITLEEFLLAPDPVNARLVPVIGLMMRLAA